MKGFCLQTLMIGCILLVSGASYIHAQELQAKITINHAQISGTDNAVFDNLQQTLERFVNERQWTHLQFQKNERTAGFLFLDKQLQLPVEIRLVHPHMLSGYLQLRGSLVHS